MYLNEFFQQIKNHPILFLGTGFSLRYLKKSYTWEGLLQKIADDLFYDDSNPNWQREYLRLKSRCFINDNVSFELVAQELETIFNATVIDNDNEIFNGVREQYFESIDNNKKFSAFKAYISELLSNHEIREDKVSEIEELIKARKNLSAVITTNYDLLTERTFEFFTPLIGNNILLSNPYGSIYKIHGCVSDSRNIIITAEDYEKFDKKYELIKAQMLSLFMHNPVIFIGYSITDENIRSILKTIFSYVDTNSEMAQKIRNNFLLVEYEPNSQSIEVLAHDIDIKDIGIIRIKTDNFSEIFRNISNLVLPISAMDIRKVQNIYHDIVKGSDGIKVTITVDPSKLHNNQTVLAIGTEQNLQVQFRNFNEIISDYFNIIAESNESLANLINKQENLQQRIIPIFGLSNVSNKINNLDQLKEIQIDRLKKIYSSIPQTAKIIRSFDEIEHCEAKVSNKYNQIYWNIFNENISIDEIAVHLKTGKCLGKNSDDSLFKNLLSLYDYLKYGGTIHSLIS
ncbi:TPA: SIR2 family protein [Acinetobacter baumannii]|nr:SIR2 family protein [Acinetobacter baumannii]